jgi:prepilin-type N-terminal cleavage/methylation domain-containing protein
MRGEGLGGGGGARRLERGFTIIEIMVVFSIIALVAMIAAIFSRRHVVNQRVDEATGMLTELANKQQAFWAARGHFVSLRADGRRELPGPDEDPAAFYPLAADSPQLASLRTPARVEERSLWPAGWQSIGVVPPGDVLYCTYLVNAGDKGRPDPSLRFGAALLPTESAGPWFYALAVCNLNGRAAYPDDVTVYGLSSQNGNIRTFNRGK